MPLLPRIAHRLAMAIAQISIGDPVIVHPGVYIVHGQVVMDGLVEVHPGAVIAPWVTLGLRGGNVVGPTIEAGRQHRHRRQGDRAVRVGAGRPDRRQRRGALATSTPGTTVVGIPARPTGSPGPPRVTMSSSTDYRRP